MSILDFSRPHWTAAAVTAVYLGLCPVIAHAADPAGQAAAEADTAAGEPSVGRAAAKGLTFKTASALKKVLIYSLGTGSLAAGGTLTAITTVTSYATYVANDYLWDSWSPDQKAAAGTGDGSFDASSSFWRNTTKYLTQKPVAMATSWSIVYLYTGSWTATVAMSSLSSLTGPAVFYANNMAWDWYDWYTKPAPQEPPKPQPVLVGAR
ncbi:MAG: hypothetical protein WDN25_09545 [Acetobacteraceae bacterium]